MSHASISSQSVATVESEHIGYSHDDQRESPDMKNFIKESCDSEKFTITQAQAFVQLSFPFLNSRAQLKAFVTSLYMHAVAHLYSTSSFKVFLFQVPR